MYVRTHRLLRFAFTQPLGRGYIDKILELFLLLIACLAARQCQASVKKDAFSGI